MTKGAPNKTFGHAIAIQTSGPDAVEDFEKTLGQARDMVSRSIVQSIKACHALGYDIDVDSVKVVEEQREDTYVLTWRMQGRQTVPLWRRLIRKFRR